MKLMGIVRLPHFDDNWRKDAIHHYSPVAITQDQFREVKKYLNFANNSPLAAPQTPARCNLGKIRPIIPFLGYQFTAVCIAAKTLTSTKR